MKSPQLVPEKRPTIAQIRNHCFFTRPVTFTPHKLPLSALNSVPTFATSAPCTTMNHKPMTEGDSEASNQPPSAANKITRTRADGMKLSLKSTRAPSKLQLLVKGTQDSPRNIVINKKEGHHNRFHDSVDNVSAPMESRGPSVRRSASPEVIAEAGSGVGNITPLPNASSRPSSALGYGVCNRGSSTHIDNSARPQTARMASSTSSGDRVQGGKELASRHRHADRLAALNERLGRMELRAFSGSANVRETVGGKYSGKITSGVSLNQNPRRRM